jgi:hypothetical protein
VTRTAARPASLTSPTSLNSRNHQLPGTFQNRVQITYETDLTKAEIVRRLSTPNKLHKVIPIVTGERSIKGTVYWERFVRVRRMRDALVHVKEGNYSTDPDDPSTYGLLLRGDADDCVLDVCALVTKLDPSRLSEAARKALKMPTVSSV